MTRRHRRPFRLRSVADEIAATSVGSWWTKASRSDFTARAWAELGRMQGSRFAGGAGPYGYDERQHSSSLDLYRHKKAVRAR